MRKVAFMSGYQRQAGMQFLVAQASQQRWMKPGMKDLVCCRVAQYVSRHCITCWRGLR